MKSAIVLLLVAAVILVIVYYGYNTEFLYFWTKIYNYTSNNLPWLEPALFYMQEHITAGTKEGLAIYSLVGKIPVLPMPMEPYVLYVSSKGLTLTDIMLYGGIFTTIGACLNYLFGYVFGTRVVSYIFGEMSDWQEDLIQKIGAPMSFLAAILPFPDITSMVFGAYKVNFLYFAVFTLAGICLKFYALLTGSYEAFNFLQKNYNVSSMFSLLGK